MARAIGSEGRPDAAIAARVRRLRAARGLTLIGLAARSGVSRAMLSRIERGQSSPTAGLLAKLCDGLGVSLPALLDGEVARDASPVARRAEQPVWRDAGSGYLRRAVSPPGAPSGLAIAEVELPSGATVLLETSDGASLDRCVWVLDGAVQVCCGDVNTALEAGDCLRLGSVGPVGFHNGGPTVARYALITGRAEGAAKEPAEAP